LVFDFGDAERAGFLEILGLKARRCYKETKVEKLNYRWSLSRLNSTL
jgi:hypothetical protein